MATEIFLGEPPANIKQWIIDHATPPGPAGHADTRFTLKGGTVETYNITGTLDDQWMIDNGYFDEDNLEWLKNITQADIGNTVTSIGDDVFRECARFTSVTIPDSVTSIGGCAFEWCTDLTSVTIPDSVMSIGKKAFNECYSLTSVTIPDSVTSIGIDAFWGCYLTNVTIVGNGGNANNVKQMIIAAIDDTEISDNIIWNMPS